MLALVVIVIAIVAALALAMRRAKLWHWALAALVVGVLTRFGWSPDGATFGIYTDLAGWILALLPAVLLGLLSIGAIRRAVVIGPAYTLVKSILPRVSRTEQEALDAGTVGWDAELFSGRPRWDRLLNIKKATLTPEEQAFMDGPVNTVCAMIDDWDVRHNRADLPPEVWAYLKEQGFQAVFIGVGAGLPKFLRVPGENLIGVFSANEYLTRVRRDDQALAAQMQVASAELQRWDAQVLANQDGSTASQRTVKAMNDRALEVIGLNVEQQVKRLRRLSTGSASALNSAGVSVNSQATESNTVNAEE